jgi:hypothetical protein
VAGLYVSDFQGHRIRKINASDGKISTIAGTGIAGYNGDGTPVSEAQLNFSDSSNCRVRSAGGRF